jgi:predicted extracellular nuclease
VQTPAPALVVVSQVYGGGGNAGSTFKNDFIELFNRGTTTVNVTGWSVQYTSAAGVSWQVTSLSGSIPPGRYYLVQEALGAGGTVNLPPPDATGTIAMSATAGKVALVNNAVALTGACPTGAQIADFVGYGSTANCFEGSGPTPAPRNTNANLRAHEGCTDTNNNAGDFATGSPDPRNSATPFLDCSAPPPPTPELYIHEIQGSGSASPYVGQTVKTQLTIVTGLKSNASIQEPDADADSDPNTSEGVFVFTSSAPSVAIGDAVIVRGTVAEFIPSADPNSPPVTEISGSPTITLISSGNALPTPITLTAADTSPTGSIEQLEKYEGMRVHVNSLTVIAPTQGTVNEAAATSTTNGVFYGVITGVARPFRGQRRGPGHAPGRVTLLRHAV